MTVSTTHVRRLILGTAGHIDHGKTALVERLTGVRTDRLPEERKRGMTIDIGYAAFELADGTEVGLLDVPGHERLVRTMVAAATAMDLALLVVASDDGPMPQTREHVEILDVLGVTRLVVALTKVDLVDEETMEIAEAEIEDLLAPTGMAGAPIVRVSSETGEGIDDLRAAIGEMMPPPREPRDDPHVFRMPVLRRFLVAGRGAVLTGIPIAGTLDVGERVKLLPPDAEGKVRSIQVHHRDAEQAVAGHRAALSLSDLHVEDIKRGMVLTTPGVLRPVDRLAARMRVLSSVRKPLEHGDRARLHLGAAQHVVRVHLPGRTPIAGGEAGLVELESTTPMVAAPGDRIVLRLENAASTLGGGVVIELLARRLPRRQGIVDTLLERAKHLEDPVALVRGVLHAAGERGVPLGDIAAGTALRPAVLPAILASLREEKIAVPVGRQDRWMDRAAFEQVTKRLDETVRKLHAKDSAVDSLPLATIRSALGRAEPVVLEQALDHLLAKGRLVRTATGNVHHKDHSSELPPKDKERCEKIRDLLAEGRGQPPSLEDLQADAGLSGPDVTRALRLLESRRMAFKAGEHWFDGAWIEDAKDRLRTFAAEHGGFTPSDARTLLETTRKWIIPLLEALDKTGFSRRQGDKRVIREG